MEHNNIDLSTISKSFEFEKLSRSIDSIDDVETLKKLLKTYIKLYLKQQEAVFKI